MSEQPEPTELSVGEVSRRVGCSVSALHYYERAGLVAPRRTRGNQRRYDSDDLLRVLVIAAERSVGSSVDAIRALLAKLPENGADDSGARRSFHARWRHSIDQRIDMLYRLRDESLVVLGRHR